jgi:hypothetical protein
MKQVSISAVGRLIPASASGYVAGALADQVTTGLGHYARWASTASAAIGAAVTTFALLRRVGKARRRFVVILTNLDSLAALQMDVKALNRQVGDLTQQIEGHKERFSRSDLDHQATKVALAGQTERMDTMTGQLAQLLGTLVGSLGRNHVSPPSPTPDASAGR